MSKYMSRRHALATGALAAGMIAGPESRAQQTAGKRGPRPFYLKRSGRPLGTRWQERAWSRGPDPDLVRALKPGPTSIRLACSSDATRLRYLEGKSITEAVKKIRDLGYTSTGDAHGPFAHNKWLDATDSEIAELKAALKKYDVAFFDMMTWDNIIHPDRAYREKGIRHVTESMEAAVLSVATARTIFIPESSFARADRLWVWTV